MSFAFPQAAVPPVLQILSSISAVPDTAAMHCEACKIDPATLLDWIR